MLPLRYPLLIWDLDGTLLYTLEDLHAALQYTLTRYGWPPCTLADTRCRVGNGISRLLAVSVPKGEATPHFAEALDTLKTYYSAHRADHTRPYEGVPEMLTTLKTAGAQMAVVSNKPQGSVEALVQRWFADTVSVAIGESPARARKPAPDMVYYAMQQLGTDAPAVYIGDSEVDLLTARAAQLPCLSVSWGFRDEDLLKVAGATHLFATPAVLTRYLLQE